MKEMGERLRNLNAQYEEKLERRERREEALEKGENLLTGESQRKDKGESGDDVHRRDDF